MNSALFKSAAAFILFFAVLAVLSILTNAFEVLRELSVPLFVLASLFFMASVLLWVLSWAHIIKRKSRVPLKSLLVIGFSSLYGSLTPVQLGAEALRSMGLKKNFGVPYSESISASVIVKGTKFLILAFLFLLVLSLFLLQAEASGIFLFGILSGFAVVVLAVLVFLFPLSRRLGERLSLFFEWLAKRIKPCGLLSGFFRSYSLHLRSVSPRSFLFVLVLSVFSWGLEFLALNYSFLSVGIGLNILPVLVLFVLVSVLERNPVLPRGIGLVEFVGFYYLSIPAFVDSALTVSQIGAVLVVFDVVRLAVPALLSIAVSFLFSPKKA